jgi:hypothetical protein
MVHAQASVIIEIQLPDPIVFAICDSAHWHEQTMDTDPFSTRPCRITTEEPDAVRISKPAILSMISKTPFDNIYIRKDLMTDDEAITVAFMEAIGQALTVLLIQHLPQKSSPKKLLSSCHFSPDPHLHFLQEVDTPIKPRMKPEKKPSSTFVNGIFTDNALGFMTRLAVEPQKLDQPDLSSQQKRALALQALKDEEFKSSNSSLFITTLTRAELIDTEPRDLLKDQITWSHPPDFPPNDPILQTARLEALRKLDIDSDPFHISRMERR